MNCYNSDRYLNEAINSIYNQSYQNWEIIFVDNASIDNSASIARAYGKRLKYHRLEKNIPLGGARNKAITLTKGKYITFLDCDDQWLPNKLQNQVNEFKRNSEIGFIYGNYYLIKEKKKKQILGLRGNYESGDVFSSFLFKFPVNLQTVMMSRDAINLLDELFDANLNLAEDYDFFLRLSYVAKAKYIDEPLALYRVHSNMNSITKAKFYPSEMKYCLEKLKNKYLDIEKVYKKEFEYLESKMVYWEIKGLMHESKSRYLNKRLNFPRFKNTFYFILYISTFLPRKLWLFLDNFRLYIR